MMLMRDVARRLPDWEAPAKLSLALALLLFIVMLVLGLGGPQIVQLPARIGAFGLLITAQLIVLWGNRREISPYHKAQQHFIAGEYQAARSILEGDPRIFSRVGRCTCAARQLLPAPFTLWEQPCLTGAGIATQASASFGALQCGETEPRLWRIH